MEIAIALAGLFIAWLTYTKTFYSKPIEEKENLLIQFRAIQALSQKVQKNLMDLAIANDWFDKEIFPNIAYKRYIEEMKISYQTNLLDELFEKFNQRI